MFCFISHSFTVLSLHQLSFPWSFIYIYIYIYSIKKKSSKSSADLKLHKIVLCLRSRICLHAFFFKHKCQHFHGHLLAWLFISLLLLFFFKNRKWQSKPDAGYQEWPLSELLLVEVKIGCFNLFIFHISRDCMQRLFQILI